MRRTAISTFIMAMLAGPAAAQSWQTFSYPEDGFGAAFPSQPRVQSATYNAGAGALPEKIYSVSQPTRLYRVLVIDYSTTATTQDDAINRAIADLRNEGEIKVNSAARVNQEQGRQLSVVSTDGRRSIVAIFFANHRLVQIEGTILAGDADPDSGDAGRFQQSLQFLGERAGRAFAAGNQRFAGRRGPSQQRPRFFPGAQGAPSTQAAPAPGTSAPGEQP